MPEPSIRWRRVVPVAVATLTTAAAMLGAAHASADPVGVSGAAKGGSAAAAAPSEPACTLSPSLSYKTGEQSSCLAAGVSLSRLPSLGQTATLTVTVKADRAESATGVTVDLPPTLEFADGTASAAAIDGAGTVRRASVARYALNKGDTRTLTRTVKAVGTGFGAVTARASNVVHAGRTDGGVDSLFLTVGAKAGSSTRGGGAAAGAATTHSVRSGPKATAPAVTGRLTPQATSARPSTQAPARPATAGTSCATGTWNFTDQNGTSVGAHNVTVQVRNSGNTVLASAFSGGDGSYNVCWSTGNATTQAYVQFREDNNAFTLHDLNNNIFNYSTAVTAVADGTTWNLGALYPGATADNPGLHAFQEADNEWQWMYVHETYQGGCWSPLESTCRQLVIHWQKDSTTGTYWNSSGAHLLAGSPNTLDEPVHEYGHALMYNLYGQNYPATTNCGSHDLFVTSSTTCAFTEGWADWVATSVYNNMVWTYNGGFQRDMNQTWNDSFGYPTGDQVEARVVQAMRSLTDGTKYPFDNDSGEGSGIGDNHLFFSTLGTYHPNTFADFWNDRSAGGQDVSQTALSALYQGTIDYGFRNPLTDGQPRVFPLAVPPHNYSATTTRGYWSAVAIRPGDTGDSDLTLYNDAAQTSSLGSSSYGGTNVDFVAINSNSGARALQTYYPRVQRYSANSSSAGYYLQYQQGSTTFSTGTLTAPLASGQVIANWDSSQTSGVPVYYRAVPSAGQTVALSFLNPGGTVVSRTAAVNSAVGGVGSPVSLVTTPTASGFGGLVLLNQGLSAGNVTIYADRTAPTGTSVSIAGGAATTASTTVPLTLAATDGDTGVASMQISTDGTFDTEAVVPYSTSASAVLKGANGTKYVYARFLDNAGIWSAPVKDGINLHAAPSITAMTPASGPTAGGTTLTFTGVRFTGTTKVTVGGVTATSLVVTGDTKVTVKTPAHAAAGAVTIKLFNAYGTSNTKTFTYVLAPKITAITPTSGPAAGGTVVTITGANFTATSTVKFGNAAGTNVVVVSSTKITVKSPDHATGTIDVLVTTAGGTSAPKTSDHFTFT